MLAVCTQVLSLIHEQDLFACCAETIAYAVHVASGVAQSYVEDVCTPVSLEQTNAALILSTLTA